MIYIILLIVIVIIYYIFFNLEYFMETNEDEYIIRIPKISSKAEYFTDDNLKLLTKDELNNILLNDSDNYYKRFTKLDLQVRNVNSVSEYKKKIKNIHYSNNSSDYIKILNIINKINNIFKNYNIIGFDGNKASNIKWKIGIINNNVYEYGLPHTRNDIIIISEKVLNDNRLLNILLHEKIHIYQKLYRNDIEKYLKNNNFKKSKIKTDNIRANPDIDEYIYKNANNEDMLCVYNQNPKSILDVTYYPNNNLNNEHPLEYMAYTIEYNLTK